MEPSEVIRGALELLPDEDAWAQDWGYEDDKRCVVNALHSVGTGTGALVHAVDHVADEIGLATPFACWKQVGDWNDDPHTTFEDVRLALKRALAKAEEAEGVSNV